MTLVRAPKERCVSSIYKYTEICVRQDGRIEADGILHWRGLRDSADRCEHKEEGTFINHFVTHYLINQTKNLKFYQSMIVCQALSSKLKLSVIMSNMLFYIYFNIFGIKNKWGRW